LTGPEPCSGLSAMNHLLSLLRDHAEAPRLRPS
jgi:hypothetical protein